MPHSVWESVAARRAVRFSPVLSHLDLIKYGLLQPFEQLAMPEPLSRSPVVASFRDPSGVLYRAGKRIFRLVRRSAFGDVAGFLASRTAAAFTERRQIVGTRPAVDADVESLVPADRADWVALEHDRIWFPSYPAEWPPEMLHAAGKLTIDLAVSALEDGFILKDASPFNVLFEGTRPVFVDVCSFEIAVPGQSLWLACAQFERTFLLPLLANRELGIDLSQSLLNRPDGVSSAEVFRWASLLRRFRPGFFSLVTLPVWLERAAGGSAPARTPETEPRQARWILNRVLRRTAKQLEALRPPLRDSGWTAYAPDTEQFTQKTKWFTRMLDICAPKAVLDVGCNRGDFSALAAQRGARVVALDSDPAVAGQLWRRAERENLDILPLAVNFARPTPATGWRNAENDSFPARCRGTFDLVLFLAVIHHIIAADRVPFAEIFDAAAECTTRFLIIEFISVEDPLFAKLIRRREQHFAHYTEEAFVTASAAHFQIVDRQPLPGGSRILFFMEKKTSR